MTDELKPYPFCGGEAEQCRTVGEMTGAAHWERKRKADPYFQAKAAGRALPSTGQPAAIAAWNTRADLEATASPSIATPTPAVCCLGLTPEQCAHTPSSQCEGLRPAVKVKALVWGYEELEANIWSDDRKTMHTVTSSKHWLAAPKHLSVDYGIVLIVDPRVKKPASYVLTIGMKDTRYDTLEAAKDAAQADYEARVMAALEPATPLEDPRVKALVEALRELTTCVEDGCYCSEMKMAAAVDQSRAAISALEGRT